MTSTESARGARNEIAFFALAAVVPIVPYLVLLLVRGVSRFDLIADIAWMEYDTRHVWSGDTLVGLSSRFHWSHPGPFFFWIAAPFDKLFGSAGLYVATGLVSCAATSVTVGVTRALASRTHAVAALVVITCWLAAFGNVALDPWVRTVVVLPLLAYLVLCAFLATGEARVALPAVFFGAIAGHTHVATLPTLGAAGALSLFAFFVGTIRRRGPTKRELVHLALAALLLCVTLVPPYLENRRAPAGEGNLARLYYFFAHRTEPYKSIWIALRDWAMTVGWLPERIATVGLARDDSIPFAMRFDNVPSSASAIQVAIAIAHVAAMAGAAVVAFRRRDRVSLAFVALGAIGEVLAIAAVRAIIGDVHYSLLFPATAASCLAWIGIVSTLGRELSRRWLSVLVFVATVLQCVWIARFPFVPASYPYGHDGRQKIYRVLREQSARDGRPLMIHLDGAWPIAVSMILESDRDGAEVYVGERERWGFPGGRSATNATNPRHVWFGDPWNPVPSTLTPCMTVLAQEKDITVFTSLSDVVFCDR